MRCICCNKIMSSVDLARKQRNGEYEVMCGKCLKKSRERFQLGDSAPTEQSYVEKIRLYGKITMDTDNLYGDSCSIE